MEAIQKKLRNKTLNVANVQKNKRNFGERQSKNIFNFNENENLNDEEYLPKNKNIIEHYKFLLQNQTKNKSISVISKKLQNIWLNFIQNNNLMISIVSNLMIKKLITKLLVEYDVVQKNINKNCIDAEIQFSEKLSKIFNCAKGNDKIYFLYDLNLSTIPKSE